MIKSSFRRIELALGIAGAILAAGCGGSSSDVPGNAAPTVLATTPMGGDPSAPTSRWLLATFSEPMAAGSLTSASFSASSAAGPLPGTVVCIDTVAQLRLDSRPPPNTLITAKITTAATDLSGKSLAKNYIWTFTTTASPDVTAPTVLSTDPANIGTGVALTKTINVEFSEPMARSTVNGTTFTLQGPAGPVSGVVNVVGNTAHFDPTLNLVAGTSYTATIATGAQDLSDNGLAADYVWTFSTGTGVDLTPPTILSTNPSASETGVSVNRSVSITFSEPMDAASLDTAHVFLKRPNGSLIPAAISYADGVVVLNPTNPFAANTMITASVLQGVKDTAGNSLPARKDWSFTTSAVRDTIAPTVSSTDPTDSSTGVALNKTLEVVFSEPMDATTVTANTFKLQGPGGPVAGSVTLVSNVAKFQPIANLTAGASYTATITTGVKDLSGNAMATAKVWSFTTGATLDTTPPRILSTIPADTETGVSVNQKVSVTFSEAMDSASINDTHFFLTRPGGTVVPSSISYASRVAVLSPTSPLSANTTYTASVALGTKDAAGNSIAARKDWTFTTSASTDAVPPTVISTNPANLATNVFLNKSVNASFSEAMQPTSINTSTFTVVGVPGSVTYDTVSHIGSFKPNVDLLPNTKYTARIETGVQDLAGNSMVARKFWTFTTGVQRAQEGINFGAASTYAILAGSTVTNAGPTIINGDLGVSPGSAVTGFPPGLVNGAIHAGDAQAAQAKADLIAAQLDAAGRLGGATLPGDLSGLTFTPGLYKNSTSVMLSAGNVTLDAQGDANAVFIFQMGSTLTTSTGTQVILAGGAKASNIYWSVGSSATLGVNSIFKGTILAEVSITSNNGAVTDGTFLTKTGAVTLQANTVTRGARLRR